MKEYHPETTGELDDLLKLCYFCLLRMVGSLGTSVSSRWSLFIEFLIRTFYMSFPTFQCSSIPVTACQVSSADQTGPLLCLPDLDCHGTRSFSSHFLCLRFAAVCCLALQSLADSSLFPEVLLLDVSTSISLLRPSTFHGFTIICIEDPNLYLQLTSSELRILRLLI